MPLTKKEQKAFEEMFSDIKAKSNSGFITKVADVLFEMTGNVNLTQRLKCIVTKGEKNV